MKRFTKKRKLKKWSAMLVLALLCFSAVPLRAQNWWTPSSGTYTITTYGNYIRVNGTNYLGIGSITVNNGSTLNLEFNTTRPVQLNGTITCSNGTINMSFGTNTSYPEPTIIRYTGNNMRNEAYSFIRTNLGNNDPNRIHVNITGTPEHQFVLDGNCGMHLVETNNDPYGSGKPFYNFVKDYGGTIVDNKGIVAPIMFIQGGYVNLDYVTIRNHWKDNGAGAGITIKSDPTSQIRASYVTVDHGLFEWLRAIDHGGAIYLNNKSALTDGSNFELKNSEIRNCYVFYDHPYDYTENGVFTLAGGGGGGIRSMGENRCEMTIDNCSIHDCYTNCDGGGIRWNSVLIRPLEIKNGTEVYNNWAYRRGGGMRVDALASVENCTFDNNRADFGGGGISIGVFNSGNENHLNANNGKWDPHDGVLTLGDGTFVTNNWSGEHGGGLHFQSDFIRFTQTDPDVMFYRHENGEYFKVQLNVNGATIENNVAEGDGGGVYMNRTTDFYGLEAHLNFGNIQNNTAKGNGGGLALTELLESNYTVRPGQTYYDPYLNIYWNDIVAQPIQARVGSMRPSWQDELLTMEYNTAINGGGIYIDGGDLVMVKGLVTNNSADNPNGTDGDGGGYYVIGGTVAVHGGTITENTAERYGGGFFVSVQDEVVINNDSTAAIISNNIAHRGGGAYVDQGQLVIAEEEIEGSETSIIGNQATNENSGNNRGGGVFVNSGTFTLLGGSIGKDGEGNGNYSLGTGGGAYVNYGTFTIEGGSLSYNKCRTGGAGAYINAGNVFINNGEINYNKMEDGTDANGGGIYANGGKVYVKSTDLIGNEATSSGGGIYALGNNTEVYINRVDETSKKSLFDCNKARHGGGLYASGKIVEIDYTTFNGNKASRGNNGNGGGIYVTKPGNADYTPVVNLFSETIIQNDTAMNNGGGMYFASGDITLSGPIVTGNTAKQGGGIFINDGSILVKDNTKIGTYETSKETAGSANTAIRGGGLYLNGGSVYFNGGIFAGNYATTDGGGIYVNEGAVLNLRDEAEIKDNHVDAGGRGGGVFMNGTFNLGGGSVDEKQTLKAYTNYAGESYSEATQNNVYLPNNSKYITLKSDISEQSDMQTYITKIGITTKPSEPHPHPVVYVENVETEEEWLYKLMDRISAGNGSVFDDTETHIAIHTREDYPSQKFYTDYLYFDGCWTTAVTKDPEQNLDIYPLPTGVAHHFVVEDDGWHIYTPQGLAWFISYVNNLNGCSGEHRDTNAFIEADIDMSANRWVPIGAVTSYDVASSTFAERDYLGDHYYTGEFDGQGYLVTGIRNGFLSGISLYGMFGATQGTLKNIFLDNYSNIAANVAANHGFTYYMGGVAGTANGGTIRNCEARGFMESDHWSNTVIGGLVGLVDGDDVHVHSSMAMPIISGNAHTMGGLVGEMEAGGDLKNSYSNASITTSNNGCKAGGLVGFNKGTVENCYVRLQGAEPGHFGWFACHNNGTIKICYAPNGKTNYVFEGDDPMGHGNYNPTALVSGKYGFAHTDQQITAENDYKENGPVDDLGELKGLLATLNNWVEDQDAEEGFSTWTRTMASPMNDDYPILEFVDFVGAGTKDSIYLLYRPDLNDLIGLVNRNDLETTISLMNGNQEGGCIYLYDTNPTVVSTNTGTDVRVYIAPNIGILQTDDNRLDARVGVAFDNSDGSWLGGAYYDWHMFSSALEAAPMGLLYHSNVGPYSVRDDYSNLTANGIPHTDWLNVGFMDPPKTEWFQSDDNTAATYAPEKIGYFPTDSPYGTWRGTPDNRGSFDFYFYSEYYYHWVNFKREGALANKSTVGYDYLDHWHEDQTNDFMHLHIPYENEEVMEVGKGYLMAVSEPSILMADGVLNTGDIPASVTKTQLYGYEVPLIGVNMVGNPYQSYIDADAFLTQNGLTTYYILDADAQGYIARVAGGSTPAEEDAEPFVVDYNAPQYLHPHQAFFVRVQNTGSLNFNQTMRKATLDSPFRQEAPHYAMVNMICSDAQGRNDVATIELDRPEKGGGEKIKGLRSGDANIWFCLDEQDLQVAFAPEGTTSAPLRFRAYNDGVFTLRWNMANADFHYLHLIDNITGADIDCLTASEYVFEGKKMDYTSRFRLVFDFTGIEENEDGASTQFESFAFQCGDEVVVNGEGNLEMFDMNGRMVMGCEIHGGQSSVALPTVASGMYVLRLTEAKQVKVQKMVINK